MRKKQTVKGGSRSRLDPAHRARGQAAGARDGNLLRRREGLSARVVGVEAGASGSCRPLQKASRAARAALRREGSTEDHAEAKVTVLTPEGARLTGTEWEHVHPL